MYSISYSYNIKATNPPLLSRIIQTENFHPRTSAIISKSMPRILFWESAFCNGDKGSWCEASFSCAILHFYNVRLCFFMLFSLRAVYKPVCSKWNYIRFHYHEWIGWGDTFSLFLVLLYTKNTFIFTGSNVLGA